MRITKNTDILNKDHELTCKKIYAKWHLLNYETCKEFFESGFLYSGAKAMIYYRFFGEKRLKELLERELNTDEEKGRFKEAVRTVLYTEIRRCMPLAFSLRDFLNAQKIER